MADYVNADRVFSAFQSMTDADWDAVVYTERDCAKEQEGKTMTEEIGIIPVPSERKDIIELATAHYKATKEIAELKAEIGRLTQIIEYKCKELAESESRSKFGRRMVQERDALSKEVAELKAENDSLKHENNKLKSLILPCTGNVLGSMSPTATGITFDMAERKELLFENATLRAELLAALRELKATK